MTDPARRFEGRSAIVTGSTKGIGRATATRLGEGGASVVVNARKPDEVEETVTAFEDAGITAIGVPANLTDDDSPQRLVAAALEEFGRLDYVVNTVGVNVQYGALAQAPRDAFEKTMLANTWPPVAMVQAALAAGALSHPGAAVVNVSTIGAVQVQPMLGAYTAAKAGLDVLTRIAARELGPRGIRVNGVAPGLVRTDMARVLWEGQKGADEAAILPLQRLGEPGDIADAVAFLLSDAASWITGVTLAVDGGRLLVGDEPRELFGTFGPEAEPS